MGPGATASIRTEPSFGARVVDGHVEMAKAIDRLIDEIANVFIFTHVRLGEFRFNPENPQFLREPLAFFFPPPGNNDPHTFPREHDRRCTTDTRQRAGDQNYWLAHGYLLK